MFNKQKFFKINLGCKVNLYETNAIAAQLIKRKYHETHDINKANIVIINTCSVTNKADAKSRNIINKAKRAKLKPLVVVMGCFAQTNKKWFMKNKVHIVVGCNDKTKITKYIENYTKPINKIIDIKQVKKFQQFPNYQSLNNTRAFLKIQDGCNNYCHYCLIPYCRGQQRSMPSTNIIKAIKYFVNHNYKEIVLTGVNTTGYKDKNINFYKLLTMLNKLNGDFRIRISSLEPVDINKKIINLFASNKKRWANQIHLCLQSANNQILQQMNRKYSFNDFLKLVKYIRTKMPHVAITTDYIVGYGLETKQQFDIGLANLKKLKLANINIFIYSRRKGTIADKLYKHDLDPIICRQRYNKVEQVKISAKKAYLHSLINKTLDVIIEKSNNKPWWHGYSSEYVKVYCYSNQNLLGRKIKIKPTKYYKDGLFGKIIES